MQPQVEPYDAVRVTDEAPQRFSTRRKTRWPKAQLGRDSMTRIGHSGFGYWLRVRVVLVCCGGSVWLRWLG